jgi:hypothetical protein
VALALVSQPSSATGVPLPAGGLTQLDLPRSHVEVQSPLTHSSDMTPLVEHGRLHAPQCVTLLETCVSHPGGLFSQSLKPL